MGHQTTVPVDLGLSASWRQAEQGLWTGRDQERLSQRIFEDVKKIHQNHGLDLFFCYLYPFQFKPSLLKQVEKLGIPTVYFFCDNFSHPGVAKDYAPQATLNWVPEKEALAQFKASGCTYIHLPMAANPRVYYPIPSEENVDVSFVGTKNPYRRQLLGRAQALGLNLSVSGDGWSPAHQNYLSEKMEIIDRFKAFVHWKQSSLWSFLRYGLAPKRRSAWYLKLGEEFEDNLRAAIQERPLSLADMNQYYNSRTMHVNKYYSLSKVSLGICEQFIPTRKGGMIFYSKLRDFEATMAGACFLTQKTPEIHDFFIEGEDVMTYATPEELVEKAIFLLKNDVLRKKMRINCRNKALANHTWQHRFEKIFSTLGLS
jgi:spore maturation protein CgeB